MWNTKSMPNTPKNRKFVTKRHTWPFSHMSFVFKYRLSGVIT